jgi:serine/threonine protein phosphatase PrpC
MRIESASATNRGRVRNTNADAVALHPRLGLFAVADGVGTDRRGDVAARIAVECLKERFSQPSTRWPAPGVAPRGQELVWSLRQAIEECHRRILHEPQRETAAGRMATTVAALAIRRGQTVVAHVGDSRVLSPPLRASSAASRATTPSFRG